VNAQSLREIAEWFIKTHGDRWVRNNRLISWAGKLGISLNLDGKLDEEQLFRLFVLAVLWNNRPTSRAERGVQVFEEIKDDYKLQYFRVAIQNNDRERKLKEIALQRIRNLGIYYLLKFIANGRIWTEIKNTLESPVIGNEEDDLRRLKELSEKFRGRPAHLKVKLFLIFREIRIQFREAGKYQYHPVVCCVPDSNVRKALVKLKFLDTDRSNLDDMIRASRLIAGAFCTEEYELYDLPLFYWYREVGKKIPGDIQS